MIIFTLALTRLFILTHCPQNRLAHTAVADPDKAFGGGSQIEDAKRPLHV